MMALASNKLKKYFLWFYGPRGWGIFNVYLGRPLPGGTGSLKMFGVGLKKLSGLVRLNVRGPRGFESIRTMS